MDNIGLDEDDLIKILDADNLKFKSRIEGTKCEKNEDCFNLYGCKSNCSENGKCKMHSTNIQYVCDSMFLHGTTKTSSGLLGNNETSSSQLMDVLEHCSQLGFNDVYLVKNAIEKELQDINQRKHF